MKDYQEYHLSIVKAGSVDVFTADEPGVLYFKEAFRDERPEYLFLRKGEDFGGFAIALLDALEQSLAAIEAVHSTYQEIVDLSTVDINRIADFDWQEFKKWFLFYPPSSGVIHRRRNQRTFL